MSSIRKHSVFGAGVVGLLLRCLVGALVAGGATASAQVMVMPPLPPPPPPPSKYRETFEDLSVKVLGGRLVVKRTYDGARWLPNQAWTDLVLVKPLLNVGGSIMVASSGGGGGGGGGRDGSVSVGTVVMPPAGSGSSTPPPDIPAHAVGISSVVRMGSSYKGVGGGVYSFGRRNLIRATATGFRWQDRDGNSAEYDTAGRLLSFRDRNAVSVTVRRDADNRLTGLVDTLGRQVLWLEYADNRLSAIRDATNRRVEYQYTANRMTRFIDARGNAWTYEYTFNGTPSSRTDPEGRKVKLAGCSGWVWEAKDQDGVGAAYKCSYLASKKQFYVQAKTAGGLVAEAWYNSEGLGLRRDINGKTITTLVNDGRTRTSIDRNGGRTVNVYDEYDNLLSRTYPDGSSVRYVYGPLYSLVTQKTDEHGVITHYEYDAKGNLTRKTEALGRPEERVTVYTYDSHGNRTRATRLGDDRTPEAAYSFTYDDSGNVTSLTTPEGATTTYSYDVMGNVVTLTDPRGKVWTYGYGPTGLLVSEVDPLGSSRTFEYNKVGKKTKEVEPNGQPTLFTYDRQHRLTAISEALGKSLSYELSIDGLVTRETDEEGKARTYQYDLGMRLLREVDGNGNVSSQAFADEGQPGSGGFLDAVKIQWPTFEQRYRYDVRDRLILDTAVQGTDGINAGFAYDAKGNIVKATDANGKSWLYEYDAFGNLTKETDPLGYVTRYEYDDREDVIAIVDANGGRSRFEYDRRNRLTREIRPLGQTTRYVYDASDNIIGRIDPKGQRTRYVYDDVNRLIAREYYPTEAATVPIQTVTFTRNATGHITAWSDGTFSGTYVYDELQRKTGETVNYGAFALSNHYAYLANDQLSSFTGPDGLVYTYTYDGENQLSAVRLPTGTLTVTDYFWTEPKAVTLPGGATQAYEYNGLLGLRGLQVKGPTQSPVLDWSGVYDRTQVVTQKSAGGSAFTYAYDDATRLTLAQSSESTQQYTLDAMGNRVGDGTGTWTYNANNQLLSTPGTSYTYDENGNLLRKAQGAAQRNYFYDMENRLVRVEDQSGSVIARYGYDPFDRRLYKEAGGARTYFFYSDQGMVAEADPAGAVVRTYGHHPQSVSGTRPLFLKTSGGYAFYHLDQLGTPIALTAPDGHLVWFAQYDAFGRANVQVSEVSNNLRLPGQYLDTETGLHYNDRRYYDPDTGRYLTEDPTGIDGGMNRYLYVEADPVNNADPTGECLLAGAVGGAITGAAWSIFDQLITKGCFKAISWKDVAIDAATDAAIGAVSCGLGKFLKAKPRCGGNSFTGDTPVHTRQGLVMLQDVKAGDEVLSYAEWSGEESYQRVEAVLSHEDRQQVIVVTLEDGTTLEATADHPFLVSEKGWKEAWRLELGDQVRLRGKGKARIIHLERRVETARYATLLVANTHTFYVGEGGALVHNGSIYRVPGCRTPSGKPYVGRTKHDKPSKRGSRDGRKRQDGDKVDTYPDGDTEAGRRKEQEWIEREGGVPNLDNKRNEIRKKP